MALTELRGWAWFDFSHQGSNSAGPRCTPEEPLLTWAQRMAILRHHRPGKLRWGQWAFTDREGLITSPWILPEVVFGSCTSCQPGALCSAGSQCKGPRAPVDSYSICHFIPSFVPSPLPPSPSSSLLDSGKIKCHPFQRHLKASCHSASQLEQVFRVPQLGTASLQPQNSALVEPVGDSAAGELQPAREGSAILALLP